MNLSWGGGGFVRLFVGFRDVGEPAPTGFWDVCLEIHWLNIYVI
ncbi:MULTISPECIES: hypothetical protein [unclassified Microcoleus]